MVDPEAARIYQWSQRYVVRALAITSVLAGLSTMLGGPQRFNHARAFTVAAQVPGGWLTWGSLALLIGAWTLAWTIPWSRREVMWGLLAQSIFFSFWTVTILVSGVQDPRSPMTGVVIYGGYSVTCSICYVAGRELGRVGRT